ncbi:hypothetical protein LAD64_23590 [Klebsiella pneumoniae]|nr:hypothetical protein [Klebsiella pneumoniae]
MEQSAAAEPRLCRIILGDYVDVLRTASVFTVLKALTTVKVARLPAHKRGKPSALVNASRPVALFLNQFKRAPTAGLPGSIFLSGELTEI